MIQKSCDIVIGILGIRQMNSKVNNQVFVDNCKFEFQCDKRWDSLQIKEENPPSQRFCEVCTKDVYFVESSEELVFHINNRHCVAIPKELWGTSHIQSKNNINTKNQNLANKQIFSSMTPPLLPDFPLLEDTPPPTLGVMVQDPDRFIDLPLPTPLNHSYKCDCGQTVLRVFKKCPKCGSSTDDVSQLDSEPVSFSSPKKYTFWLLCGAVVGCLYYFFG
jgi:hypothetical protein